MQTLLSTQRNPPLRLSRFFSSIMAHVVLLAATIALSRYIVSESDEIDWSRFRVEPLRLYESVPIFFVPDTAPTAVTAGKPIGGGKAGPTVLEPDYRPEAKLPRSVPPLAHWSKIASPHSPKAAAQSIIRPGIAEGPSPAPRLTAPPSLATPNREATAGTVNISLPPSGTSSRPQLTVASSSTLPIKTGESGPARAASFDMSAGQPVNVLALAESRSREPYVEIERGLQNVSGSGESGGWGSSLRADIRDDGTSAMRPGTSGSAASAGRSPENPTRGLELVKPLASGVTLRALPESELKRVIHPVNGGYDVVVAQAATVHDSAAQVSSAGAGTVYTVYLPVGDEKEWLLEFRNVASSRPQQSSFQISIGDEDPIAPPFPISTVIPTKLLSAFSGKLVLHGSITAAGRLRNFQAAGPTSVNSELILQLLEEWRFRPAMRNRIPIQVDVRLIVPPRS